MAENTIAGHFSDHFKELRKRVLISFCAIIIFTIVAYIFSRPITQFFMKPLFAAHPDLAGLVYTNLPEAFIAYLKVAVLVGLCGSFPVLCYQLWMFVGPGLRKAERTVALNVVFWATLLFVCGVVFAFFIVLPEALAFFMGFAGKDLEAMPKLDSYLTFIARTCLAFGLSFEIPFLMVAARRTGLVTREYFTNNRWVFYLAILVMSFLLTAGDLFSAFLLAIPLFGLYEAGILVMLIL
ncbi:MAG: twin-arginine translocase subunit TatC [Proteobacteria bacterium]|nr:twin-arginine translocase subunit TatC [Pseudomonadota bacterium]MBU1716855.1 twin-arginine translocase subunit TatC [Pseudomonadota bacterium]